MSSLASSNTPSQALASGEVDPQQHFNNLAPEGSQIVDAKRNDVAVEIKEILATVEAPLTNTRWRCIYKVPHRLHKLNQNAYTPKVVSIGPFHHGNWTLKNTEREKWIFLQKFIKRTNTDLDRLVSHVEDLEPMVRGCYSENIEFNKKELVKIILVDAGFILELFIWSKRGGWKSDDRLSLNSWLIGDVLRDLLLLENQLPFFVLDRIFTFAKPANIPESLLDLTLKMFSYFNLQNIGPVHASSLLHFTDLLRTFHLPLRPPSLVDRFRTRSRILDKFRTQQGKWAKHLYSVTELHEAGVKFEASTSRCLLNLEFSDHVLEIPTLEVVDSTELLFRNMLALEQCHYRFQSYIVDYIVLLDYLINKERDVDLLVRRGIVKSWLGENKDVAKLVNGLGKNNFVENVNSHYEELCNNLNTFGRKSWRITVPTVKRRYCNTPWQTAASFAAFFILSFTLIQTVCSLYQVFNGT